MQMPIIIMMELHADPGGLTSCWSIHLFVYFSWDSQEK